MNMILVNRNHGRSFFAFLESKKIITICVSSLVSVFDFRVYGYAQ